MNLRTRGAALALAAPLALGLLAGCGDDEPEPASSDTGTDASDPSPSPSEAPSSAPGDGPSSSPEESGAPSTEPGEPGATTAAPVYFTGDSPFGQRLYREFREVGSDNPLEEAAALLVAGDALDPDYGTLLNGVRIEAVAQEDGALVVTLAEDSVTSPDKSLSPADARLAVQSLVYTLQGVAGSRLPVRVVLADGAPVDLLGQPTGDGVEAAKPLKVLALVSLTTPEEGATASGTLSVEGVASSFEATVPFFVTDASGSEVLRDFATAEGWLDDLYPWSAEVDISSLAPGEYVLHAMTDDPSGGEGPGPYEDTRTFTVG
ncbi:Gmad2 immunoglobulin-like domain-containing protein [Nocardioides dongxiaopingii]|uniref:Gmad2 immunoglobulin-like domain-containing protein n=1 Tax=Nocardioides sp. S-1144 TaxID=2582905 RepID=UPI0016525D75|nr:Gmad2 immunoglobulin-like domain-containing protein [Nocardioides sp. S-1144]